MGNDARQSVLSISKERENMSELQEKIRYSDNTLTFWDNECMTEIRPFGRDGLRITMTPYGGKKTRDWALDIPLFREGRFEESENKITLQNGNISVSLSNSYTQQGHMAFYKHTAGKKELLFEEHDYVVWAHNPGTHIFNPTDNGLFEFELHLAAYDNEQFYGMGENSTGHINLKGSIIDLYQRHVKAVVPFTVSSRGYGFLWNNPSLGRAEFGNNMTRWISYGCSSADFLVFAGDSYADLLEKYADATGHAPAFPYWASGFWQCKLRYETQQELLATAREYKKRGLPLSVIVIDYLHWKHIGDWKLDPQFWPNPEDMVHELQEMGVRVMISPWTLIDEQSENFIPMKEAGLFTSSIDGKHDTVDFYGPKHQYDPTNPEAAAYLWNQWKKNYFDLGIRTFWLDPCDEFHAIQDYDKVQFYIGPAKEAHSYFVTCHQRNIFNGLTHAGENEIVTICRNGWLGSQRYGACIAPHDIFSSFAHLKEYIRVGLNVMMSGIVWWTCDIGGFITPDSSGPVFSELMVRWYQYGMFLPVFRTHGRRKNNEAWNLGGDSLIHIASVMHARERLRPYVMEQMQLASLHGIPPMRPLIFDFTADENTVGIEDEFMFGPDILVCPVTDYGIRERMVYLPKGCDWIDVFSEKTFPGGTCISNAPAPLSHIPLYVRSSGRKLVSILKGK